MACLGLLEVFQMCIDFEVCSIDFKVYRSLGWEDPLEEGMAAHSSILAWRIPMDREAWWATVHGVSESDTTEATEHTCTHPDIVLLCIGSSLLGSQASCLGPCHSRPCLVASTTIFRTWPLFVLDPGLWRSALSVLLLRERSACLYATEEAFWLSRYLLIGV